MQLFSGKKSEVALIFLQLVVGLEDLGRFFQTKCFYGSFNDISQLTTVDRTHPPIQNAKPSAGKVI